MMKLKHPSQGCRYSLITGAEFWFERTITFYRTAVETQQNVVCQRAGSSIQCNRELCSNLCVFHAPWWACKRVGIDQDACLVYEEKYGEVTTTRVFKDFLVEQDLQLFVCRKADPATKGPVENSIKYVKQNYLPSRKDWSIQKLIEKLPDWCKRKNSRIHTKELWKIDDHFQKYEKGALRSLNPSQYDRIGSARIKVSVTKTRQARFRTNRYVLPRDYCENYVWMHVTSTKIMFYTTPEAHTPVCCYDLPSEKVRTSFMNIRNSRKGPAQHIKTSTKGLSKNGMLLS